MKLLLTSGGVTNPSIHAALVDLNGPPMILGNDRAAVFDLRMGFQRDA